MLPPKKPNSYRNSRFSVIVALKNDQQLQISLFNPFTTVCSKSSSPSLWPLCNCLCLCFLEKALPSAPAVQLFARKRANNCIKSSFLCNCLRENRGTIAHAFFWFYFRKNCIPLDIPCFRTLSGGISDGKRHNSIYASMYLIKISGRKSGKPFSSHEKKGCLATSSLNRPINKLSLATHPQPS